MRQIFLSCLILILFAGCKKENSSRVEIYLLKSFTATVDQSITPTTISITNAVLEDTPLVSDQDIRFYTKANTTFTLRKNLPASIQNYGQDKGFAVTVDNQPIYYGRFHPLFLSSMTIGVATIAPIPNTNNELKIGFVKIDGNSALQQLDKRNDSKIINALKATNRVR